MTRIGLLIVVLAMALPVPAASEPGDGCGRHDILLRVYLDKFQERPIAMALDASGLMLEVLASEGGATWTILYVRADGMACPVANGEGWRDAATAPGDSL